MSGHLETAPSGQRARSAWQRPATTAARLGMNGVIRRMASRQHKSRKFSISPNSRLEALKLYLSHYCVKSVRTSSMVTCGRPPTTISRMLPACTGNCRRQCCGINPSEQPSLGASSQPRLRKAILEREAGQIMRMAPFVSLVVAVATLAAAAPTATVQLLRAAATVCKLNAGSTGDTSFKVGAALVQQRCPGNCLAVATVHR